ncbi:MAG: hypothetical protein JO100_11730 [Pseudonocardia sp.]|nr:hypothetical protein [Pseudonocardia sp.]
MSTVTAPTVAADSLATFDVAAATASGLEVSSKVSDDGVIQVVTFNGGRYYLHYRAGKPGVNVPHDYLLLNEGQLSALLDSLEDVGDYGTPPTLDKAALEAFVAVLERDISADASNRFKQAKFGAIVQDKLSGIIGHLSFGTDLAGSIHDKDGSITFEQHALPLPPGRYRPLALVDTDSLAAALNAYLDETNNPDPLWRTVLTDLQARR